MARWIEKPVVSSSTGVELRKILCVAIDTPAGVYEVWAEIGRHRADLGDGPARDLWIAVLKEIEDGPDASETMERLIRTVQGRVKAVRGRLDAVLAAEVAASTREADVYSAFVVGGGSRRRPVLDRAALRQGVRRIASDDYSVLNIVGEPGSGKSYSEHFLRHVAEAPEPGCQLLQLDVEREWPVQTVTEVGCQEFARALAQTVGLDTVFDVDPLTEITRVSRELARMFACRLREKGNGHHGQSPVRRWIFIDGLDRPVVRDDVLSFVGHLAYDAEIGQLGGTRLILTGHPGAFAPRVLDGLIEETIAPITTEHLRAFFGAVAARAGSPIETEDLERLAEEALQRAPLTNLSGLADAAKNVAVARFGSL